MAKKSGRQKVRRKKKTSPPAGQGTGERPRRPAQRLAAKTTARTGVAVGQGKPPLGRSRQKREPWKRDYEMGKHGGARSLIPPDDMLVRRDRGVAVTRAKYEGLPLIFRALPMFDPERPAEAWDAYKRGMGIYDFGDWMRRLPVARFVGEGRECYTFMRYDPRGVEEGEKPVDPYAVLYGALYHRVVTEKKPRHRSWLKLFGDRRSVLSRPTHLVLVQGIIYANHKKVYIADDQNPMGLGSRDLTQVIELHPSAGEDLINQLNSEKRDYEGDPDDWHARLKYGNIVDPAAGAFIYQYNPTWWTPPRKKSARPRHNDRYEESRGGRGRTSAPEGFEVYLSQRLFIGEQNQHVSCSLDESQMSAAVDKIQLWKDLLRWPQGPEDTCLHIVRALRNFPDARGVVEFGWADNPEFRTEEVEKILAHAKAVRVNRRLPDREDEEDEMSERLSQWAKEAPNKKKRKRRRRPSKEEEEADSEEEDVSEADFEDEDDKGATQVEDEDDKGATQAEPEDDEEGDFDDEEGDFDDEEEDFDDEEEDFDDEDEYEDEDEEEEDENEDESSEENESEYESEQEEDGAGGEEAEEAADPKTDGLETAEPETAGPAGEGEATQTADEAAGAKMNAAMAAVERSDRRSEGETPGKEEEGPASPKRSAGKKRGPRKKKGTAKE